MDIIEELKRIANLLPADLTAEDKAFIKAQAQAAGVEFSPRSACKSCYIDEAIVLYRLLRDNSAAENVENENRKYILREGVDVVWRNIRINKDTITDAKAEEYLRSGFPRKFFL